jgi:hypothetical protein
MKFGLSIVLFASILILIVILYVYILVPPLFQKKPYWEFVRTRQNRILGRISKNNLLFGIAYLLIAILIVYLVTYMTTK